MAKNKGKKKGIAGPIAAGVVALGIIGSFGSDAPAGNTPSVTEPPAIVETKKEPETKVETSVSIPPVEKEENSFEAVSQEKAFAEQLEQYAYVGSSNSDKYHYPSCRWTDDINASNLVHFDTEDEASAAGYTPCGTCNP